MVYMNCRVWSCFMSSCFWENAAIYWFNKQNEQNEQKELGGSHQILHQPLLYFHNVLICIWYYTKEHGDQKYRWKCKNQESFSQWDFTSVSSATAFKIICFYRKQRISITLCAANSAFLCIDIMYATKYFSIKEKSIKIQILNKCFI